MLPDLANGQYNFLNDGDRRPANSRDELRSKAASTVPILMNTSNRDLREVFNWGCSPCDARKVEKEAGREIEEERAREGGCRGGGGGDGQRSACMIFQYCRSTLSLIFAADYISLLPYPNLRDHFTTTASTASIPREEAFEWNRSVGPCAPSARSACRPTDRPIDRPRG